MEEHQSTPDDAINLLPINNEADILQNISSIANHPLRIEQRTKLTKGEGDDLVETSVRFPVWIEPHARGWTAMCAAYRSFRQKILFTRESNCVDNAVIEGGDRLSTARNFRSIPDSGYQVPGARKFRE
jgi:hypothetical protein